MIFHELPSTFNLVVPQGDNSFALCDSKLKQIYFISPASEVNHPIKFERPEYNKQNYRTHSQNVCLIHPEHKKFYVGWESLLIPNIYGKNEFYYEFPSWYNGVKTNEELKIDRKISNIIDRLKRFLCDKNDKSMMLYASTFTYYHNIIIKSIFNSNNSKYIFCHKDFGSVGFLMSEENIKKFAKIEKDEVLVGTLYSDECKVLKLGKNVVGVGMSRDGTTAIAAVKNGLFVLDI